MKKILLSIVIAVSFSFPVHAETVVDVKGMVCDFCAQALNKVFLKEEAVDSLDVNLDEQTVTIFYKDGAEPLKNEQIEKMVYWAGYEVEGIRTE